MTSLPASPRPGTIDCERALASPREFDAILDVRSPSEFADDHIPGALSAPVLSDAQRAEVGTLHQQVSSFAARKRGAALVARNIAQLLDDGLSDHGRQWRPLVYCWRGGSRSAALMHVLERIGWPARQLEGGYRAYRRHVLAALEELPARFCYQVICGTTGSGKSRLLQRLHEANAQVLDLERLAQHRGSVLGALPEQPQPSQKWFESQIWSALRAFDPQQPVYVESESSKVGNLRVPPHLLEAMRAAECRHLQLPVAARVRLLREEYLHFERDPDALCRQLACLIPQHGHACVSAWQLLARAARWDELVENLLVEHYDPAYRRSLARNFAARDAADVLQLAAGSDAEFIALAQSLTQSHADAKAPITSASQIAPAEPTRRIEA